MRADARVLKGLPMPAENLHELFVDELKDIYDAEKQLTKALPKMAKAADSQDLRAAFEEHLEITRMQVNRLEEVFKSLGMAARGKPCEGMKGLIEEGKEMMEELERGATLDAALISAGPEGRALRDRDLRHPGDVCRDPGTSGRERSARADARRREGSGREADAGGRPDQLPGGN